MALAEELGTALKSILPVARFNVAGHVYAVADYRQAHVLSGAHWPARPAPRSWLEHADVIVPEAALAMLCEMLAKAMAPYVDDRNRVGSGITLEIGGGPVPSEIADYSRGLVASAALFGVSRTSEAMLGWITGEPVRYTRVTVLRGIELEAPQELCEGVWFERLPNRGEELAKLVSEELMERIDSNPGEIDLPNSTVLCCDATAGPAFHHPRKADASSGRARVTVEPAFPAGDWPLLLQALSLACDSRVRPTYWWTRVPHGPTRVIFRTLQSGWRQYLDPGYSTEGPKMLTQALLERSRVLVEQLRKLGGALDPAIGRWLSSKQSSPLDQFIDLRISLESLYAKGSSTDVSLRVAICGAWHLGIDAEERMRYFRLLREIYKCASAIVHGREPKHRPDNRSLLDEAKAACRIGILKRLDEGEPDWDTLILGVGRHTSS